MQFRSQPAERFSSFAPTRSGLLQRRCACGGAPGVDGECAECRKKRLFGLQRRATNEAESFAAPPIVREVLNSPGRPLDPATRASMELQLGHDFSRVRVHTGAKAAESARAVSALVYTVGPHVAFDSGRYEPQTRRGRRLLAHELTHAVQQGVAPPLRGDTAHADAPAPGMAPKPVIQRQAVGSRGNVELRGTGASIPSEGPWSLMSHPRLGVVWYNRHTNNYYLQPPRSKSLTVLDWGEDWNAYNFAGGIMRVGEINATNVRGMVDRITERVSVFPEAECIDDLTIIGHGRPGAISVGGGVYIVQGKSIGGGVIDPQSPDYSQEIRTALSEITPLFCNTANVTLRGCNVGQGVAGAEFLRLLAELWRVPVRGPIGLVRAGGMWLEGAWQWGIPRGGATPAPRLLAGQVERLRRENPSGGAESLMFDLLEEAKSSGLLAQVIDLITRDGMWTGIETALRTSDAARLQRLQSP